jgi:hypothetical protein
MNIADHFFSAELLPPNEECPIENQFARQFASCILFTFSSAELLEKAMQRERENSLPRCFLEDPPFAWRPRTSGVLVCARSYEGTAQSDVGCLG